MGNWKTVFDKTTGLQDQNVRFAYMDQEKNLWLGLDNGISHLALNSPIQQWNNAQGLAGGVVFANTYQGSLYVSTGLDLYYFNKKTVRSRREH